MAKNKFKPAHIVSAGTFSALKKAVETIIWADDNCHYEAPPEFQDAVKAARAAKRKLTGKC